MGMRMQMHGQLVRAVLSASILLGTAAGVSTQPTAPPPEVASLVRALKDADPLAREAAARALGEHGAAAADAVAPLIETFSGEDLYLRGAAAVALGRIGRPAVPALVRAMGSPNAEVRRSAGIALGRVGRDAAAAIPALITAAADADDDVRHVAVIALGGLGSAARDALPVLTDALHDSNGSVRAAARRSLRQVDAASLAARTGLADVRATIDRLVPALMAELHVPGVSVALVHGGQLAWSGAYGVSNAASKSPVTKDTTFEAASMSKPIFGLLAMQLVEQGRLALDTPLSGYTDELLVPDQPERRQVTARMTLSHTAGFPNWRPGGEERESPLPLLFTPGSRYNYSGEGIFYLQRIVERVAGQSLDRLAQDRLFAPLGLKHIGYAWTPAIETTLATGHKDDGTVLRKTKYTHPNAAYTMYTSADDYARLLVEVLKAARGASALVSQASIREMLTRQLELNGTEPIERPGNTGAERVYRGLGWAINSTAQGDVAHHTGSNGSGFRCFSQFSVDRGTAMVILTNGSRGSELWTRVVAAVGDF